MGREAEHVFKSFTLAEGNDAKIDVILAKFDEHFVSKRNINHVRALFHQWNQNQRETVESFVRSLYIAEHCEQVGIRKYGIGFSLDSCIKMCC